MKAIIIVFLGDNESIFCESMKQYNEILKKDGKKVTGAVLSVFDENGKLVYNSLKLEGLE